jgi:NhaP-type Na+/H+ or K+/H+ antiporter
MSVSDLAIVAALIFAWGAVSSRLQRLDVTAPIIFVIAGLVLTHGPLGALGFAPSHETVKVLAEATLVLVLFSDASRVGLRDLQAELGLCLRLLGIGLPLTIGLGMLLALALFGHINVWLALLIGAALAPTDAALGAGVMLNRAVPARIRRLLNLESGLNDGIATPFVLVAVAGAGTAAHEAVTGPGGAVAELALGLVVGVVVGGVGGWLVRQGSRRDWVAEGFAGAAVLGLAVCAYASAVALHGNGFIAAFTGGLAFASTAARRGEPLVPFVEETGALVSLLVWLAFGAIAVAPVLEHLIWQLVVYAVLSLTVVRMAPVALALIGAKLGWPTVAFVGWFGPRGLASVVFALLALEDLGEKAASPAVAAITATVLLSVIAHGVSAEPLARRYGAVSTPAGTPPDSSAPPEPEVPTRRLTRLSDYQVSSISSSVPSSSTSNSTFRWTRSGTWATNRRSARSITTSLLEESSSAMACRRAAASSRESDTFSFNSISST